MPLPTVIAPQEPRAGSVVRAVARELLRDRRDVGRGLTGYEISKRTGIASGTVKRTLDRLYGCKCDLLARTDDPTGLRVAYRYRLTENGEDYAKRALAKSRRRPH
jgi:DNA-binding MarR family transcriptional regulator